MSEDGRSITFTIREGLTFHSGNPVRPEDVVFSLRRAVVLDLTPSFILTQFGFTADNVEETITMDGNTVTIVTDKPYATSFVLNCLTATVGSESWTMETGHGQRPGRRRHGQHLAEDQLRPGAGGRLRA